jgi:purine-binding chemotaxis protein CheW
MTEYCTFKLDSLLLGISVANVQEVLRQSEVTKVPLAGEMVSGLVNLRGQIVVALDLRRRFGMAELPADSQMSLVVVVDQEPVALLVDDIGDVVSVDESHFEDVPDTLDPELKNLIDAVYRVPEGLLCLLDLKAAVSMMAVA